jgi:predicted nucleic acid-binding protein
LLLVDTNVILDVIEDDPDWANWSQTRLDAAALEYTLLINPVIYAELSIAYLRIEELEVMLSAGGFRMDPIPREARPRRYENRRTAGFLHRRACGGCRDSVVDARRATVSQLFPRARDHPS